MTCFSLLIQGEVIHNRDDLHLTITYEEQQKKQAEERICPADIRAQSEAWPCPAPLSDICGSYTEGGYGDILITREGDGLKLELGTLSLHGFHYRDRYFLFSEEHVLPGLQLEAEAETDRDGNVTASLLLWSLRIKRRFVL